MARRRPRRRPWAAGEASGGGAYEFRVRFELGEISNVLSRPREMAGGGGGSRAARCGGDAAGRAVEDNRWAGMAAGATKHNVSEGQVCGEEGGRWTVRLPVRSLVGWVVEEAGGGKR